MLPRYAIEGFHTPKAGSNEEEYEDAFSYRIDEVAGFARVAVADGATESFHSAQWASALVDAFVQEQFGTWGGDKWVKEAQRTFDGGIDLGSLPWHAAIKAASGSHATFMGLEVDLQRCRYRTYSVGDSCLLVTGKTPRLFPKAIARRPVFNASPDLLSSKNTDLPYPRKTTSREYEDKHTSFYLMTDALAEALSTLTESDLYRISGILSKIRGQGDFLEVVHYLRSAKAMKNDDVTLVRLKALKVDSGS